MSGGESRVTLARLKKSVRYVPVDIFDDSLRTSTIAAFLLNYVEKEQEKMLGIIQKIN